MYVSGELKPSHTESFYNVSSQLIPQWMSQHLREAKLSLPCICRQQKRCTLSV